MSRKYALETSELICWFRSAQSGQLCPQALTGQTPLPMVAGFTEISRSDRVCGTKIYHGGICAILPKSVHYQGVTEHILAVGLAGSPLRSSFYLHGHIRLS